MALPLDKDGPQPPSSPRTNLVHVMTRTGRVQPEPGGFQWMDDLVVMYPQSATQVDALAHVGYDGFLYNGVRIGTVDEKGAHRLGVDTLSGGISGRGVLLDLPRHLGVQRLPPAYVVTPAELDSCAAAQGSDVLAGDIVLIRTGWMQELRERGPEAYMAQEPGIDLPVTVWLADHRVAFLASDNWAVEVVPSVTGAIMPVHCVVLRDLGMCLGEMFQLEDLARSCAGLGRWCFLFVAQPLPITGGVGSPVNPLAIM
jgi:kynurenine formamidase